MVYSSRDYLTTEFTESTEKSVKGSVSSAIFVEKRRYPL